MKIKAGDRLRILFEYDYNSCNWGYLADFDVHKVGKKLFITSRIEKDGEPTLSFFMNSPPILMNILEYRKISKKSPNSWANFTGDEDWGSSKKIFKKAEKGDYKIK